MPLINPVEHQPGTKIKAVLSPHRDEYQLPFCTIFTIRRWDDDRHVQLEEGSNGWFRAKLFIPYAGIKRNLPSWF